MAGRDDALWVAEQLCARMAHDFSGSTGALNSLLELSLDHPDHAAEALQVANETASQLVHRLRLLRTAWGPTTEPLTPDRLRDLALGLAQTRCTVDLDGLPANAVFPPATARMVVNLLLLAADALPIGGVATLTGKADDLVVAVNGRRAAWPVGLAACIASPEGAWDVLEEPRKVQMALTVLLAESMRFRLSLLMGAAEAGPPPLRMVAPDA